jgi:hypothetical protein
MKNWSSISWRGKDQCTFLGTLIWIYIVLAHCSNGAQVNMSQHMSTLHETELMREKTAVINCNVAWLFRWNSVCYHADHYTTEATKPILHVTRMPILVSNVSFDYTQALCTLKFIWDDEISQVDRTGYCLDKN